MSSAITAVVVKGTYDKRQADKAQHARDASQIKQEGLEAEQTEQQREDFAPYRQAGGRALTRLEALMSGETDISETEGYKFRLQEGYKGLEASQAGRRLGGRAAKEALRYGQDYATGEYGAEYDRLRGLVDVGLSGAARTANIGAASTARLSSMYRGKGESRATAEYEQGARGSEAIENLWTAYNAPSTPSPPPSTTPLHDQTSDLGWG